MRGFYSLTALFISGLTLLSSSLVEAKSSTGNRVLVLLDSLAEKDAYSLFWQQLQDRQFELDFKAADDPNVVLTYYNEPIYHHIVHFAPKNNRLAQSPSMKNTELVKFVKNGGSILAAVGIDASDNIRALASEFDIEIDTEAVFEHSLYNEKHNNILTSDFIGPKAIIDSSKISNPILYSGTGLSVGKVPLSTSILAANDAFLSDSYSQRASGGEVVLAGALQSRNNARVTFVGSLDVFSDEYLTATVGAKNSKTGNEEFITQLSQWTFQEKSVLKVVGHSHHKQNETEQPDWYRVKDEIVYDVDIAEYKDDEWVPYHADDVQLEVIMLDPYIRTTLKQVPTTEQFGRFEAQIRLPDVYGVFTLKVNYKRSGLSYVLAEDQVSIRPFKHNEYPRYLAAAFPYYASTGSMVVGFIVFSIVWLSTWGSRNFTQVNKKVKSN